MREQKLRTLWLIAILFFVLVHMVFFTRVARSEYPERPVTIIVGMEAGGATDISVRAIAPGASSALGQPVIVENKGGGGGTVACGSGCKCQSRWIYIVCRTKCLRR